MYNYNLMYNNTVINLVLHCNKHFYTVKNVLYLTNVLLHCNTCIITYLHNVKMYYNKVINIFMQYCSTLKYITTA